MRTDDFDFDLPAELIAQHPATPRDSARLMVLDRHSGSIEHARFSQLPEFLGPADVLVLNDTRVLPARLRVWKSPSGGRAELLLLRRMGEREWEALAGGTGHQPGSLLKVVGGPWAEIVEDLGGARRRVRFDTAIESQLERFGGVPLPPYITEPLRDPEDYQTVYAREAGSAAAPTAGLHFTAGLLEQVAARGVAVVKLTLHVGLDTFQPVTESDPAAHPIHTEWCRVGREVIEAVRRAKAAGGRVIAVGTTTVRALETVEDDPDSTNGLAPFEGPTELFILPGYGFRVVDAMLTNFHLPRSTLILMVSAFVGRERLLMAYETAIRERYRFFSFGDAMLIR